MHPSLKNKIIIVFFILLIGWFFIRILKLLIPLVIIAIALGWVWNIFDNEKDDNNYRGY